MKLGFLAIVEFFILGVVIWFWLGRYISYKKLPLWLTVLTYYGWYVSTSVVLLLPTDISSSAHEKCIQDGLSNATAFTSSSNEKYCHEPLLLLPLPVLLWLWRIVYWSAFFLCWLIYPLTQSYVTAGDFTIVERWKQSLKENLIFYGLMGIAGAGALVFFLIWGKGSPIGIAMALANAWGLLFLLLLLGYGLVEVPRELWRSANYEMELKRCHFEAVSLKETMKKKEEEMHKTMRNVKKYDQAVEDCDPFRPYINTVISKCLKNQAAYYQSCPAEGNAEMSYRQVMMLHYHFIWQEIGFVQAKSVYDTMLEKAFWLEDVLRARHAGDRTIHWTVKPRCSSQNGFLRTMEWAWNVYARPTTLRVGALICACLSLITVWCECVFFTDHPVLSIFALMTDTEAIQTNDVLLTVILSIPVCYIVYCSYYSLLRLRIFNYYRILPHGQTDGNSIQFGAALLCRIGPPLALNFLHLMKFEGSQFQLEMKNMENMPFLGGVAFNNFAPLILVVLNVFVMFNMFTKIARCLHIKRFDYEEDFSDKNIDQGRDLIKDERSKHASNDEGDIHRRGLLNSVDREDDVPAKSPTPPPPAVTHKKKDYVPPSVSRSDSPPASSSRFNSPPVTRTTSPPAGSRISRPRSTFTSSSEQTSTTTRSKSPTFVLPSASNSGSSRGAGHRFELPPAKQGGPRK